jgi:hypothetical protein
MQPKAKAKEQWPYNIVFEEKIYIVEISISAMFLEGAKKSPF